MKSYIKLVPWLAVRAALGAALGCGGAPAPGPAAPAAAPVPTGPADAAGSPGTPADPFALPPRPAEGDLFSLEDEGGSPVDVAPLRKAWAAKGIAPRPKTCAPPRRDAGPAAAPAKLDEKDAVAAAALRADLAPIACADAVTDPLVPAAGALTGRAAHVLAGLSLASKLARTALEPPTMQATTDKEKVKAFIKGPLAKWVVEQASAIEALSAAAVGLRGYGRGRAAVEAGVADLRLVDKIRSAPTPKGWDDELKAVYEAALDEALEPRKARGRDAALVGLAELAQVGVLDDRSVDAARGLLAKLYGGRRIDALDALMLPSGGTKPAGGGVPAYWVAAFPELDATTGGVVGRAKCSGAACLDYARARLEMGRTYWRRADFVEAGWAAKEAGDDPAARLVVALAATLAKGPNGAKEMMSAPSPAALGLDHVEALDALVAQGGPMAGMAAFDAAHLRSLSVPTGEPAAAYLRDVAARFDKSAELLGSPDEKRRAETRASDARSAAAAAEKK